MVQSVTLTLWGLERKNNKQILIWFIKSEGKELVMNNIIGKPEDMSLVEKIILNGIISECSTNDDNGSTIGVKSVINTSTFSGENIIIEDTGFPLTKEMEDRLGWRENKFASVRFVIGSSPIDPTKVEETIIESIYGNAKGEYNHHYSDYTGYLWTDEGFKVGGHDVPKILTANKGKYIHMEIELFENKKSFKGK